MTIAAGTRVILIRHGETEANVQQLWYGALDAPLTPRGEAQVAATAERLAAHHARSPIDAFYVSPLPRARTTAAAIVASTGLPAVTEDDLAEFSLGDWEGRALDDLRDQEQLWVRWDADPAFAPPNGESPVSFLQRATNAVRRLACRHPGGQVLIVSHGAFMSSVQAAWLGDRPSDWQRFDPPNCAVSVLVYDGDGWRGEMVNDISHLPHAARGEYSLEY